MFYLCARGLMNNYSQSSDVTVRDSFVLVSIQLTFLSYLCTCSFIPVIEYMLLLFHLPLIHMQNHCSPCLFMTWLPLITYFWLHVRLTEVLMRASGNQWIPKARWITFWTSNTFKSEVGDEHKSKFIRITVSNLFITNKGGKAYQYVGSVPQSEEYRSVFLFSLMVQHDWINC